MSAGERSGWRDEHISRRHRLWGVNCPAVDLDFVMMEYNVGLPAALVEYKKYCARALDLRHATYRALRALADREPPIPFIIAYYWPDVWAFRVYPVNESARRIYPPDRRSLSEQRFVRSLYYLRNEVVEEHVLRNLSDIPLPGATALPIIIGDERPPA